MQGCRAFGELSRTVVERRLSAADRSGTGRRGIQWFRQAFPPPPEWRNRSDPAGPYVQLPWIEGRDLVWGKVSTPAGGVGLHVLAEREVLARDIDWAIPQFAVGEDGKPLPYRIHSPHD